MFRYCWCVILFSISNFEISCGNATVFRQGLEGTILKSGLKKQQRLISFNSDGDLRIELDFNVPFITLPIKKSMDMTRTSMVNLNVGALALTGVVLFGSVVALPIILTFFNRKGAIPAKNPLTMLYSKKERQRSKYGFI